MIDLLKAFIIDAAIFIAFVSVSNQIFFKTGLSPLSPLRFRMLHGLICGLLGIVLMEFGIRYGQLVVDYRNVALILAMFNSGPLSMISASIIIVGYQIFHSGFGYTALITILVNGLLILGCNIIVNLPIRYWYRWLISVIFSLLLSTLWFTHLAYGNQTTLWVILAHYWVGTLFVSGLVYNYVRYLDITNVQYQKYKEEAVRDYLTGLYNVRSFDQFLTVALKRAVEKRESVSLLYIDIDHFKKINDRYGHPVGDMVIKGVAQILVDSCRRSDVVSRNGGEEYTVLLTNCSAEQTLEVAERIRKIVNENYFLTAQDDKIAVSVSIGVAIYPDHFTDPNEIAVRADMALYSAKQMGRNRVVSASALGKSNPSGEVSSQA